MQYLTQTINLSQSSECLILGLCEQQFLPTTAQLDQLSAGYLTSLQQQGELSAKVGQITLLRNIPNVAAERIIIVGCGKLNELNERQYKQIWQQVWTQLKQLPIKTAHNFLTELSLPQRDLYWNIRFAIESLQYQAYQFEQFKSRAKAEPVALQTIIFHVPESQQEQAKLAISQGQGVAEGVKVARDLANLPPNICTPEYLMQQAQQLAQQSALITTTVIDEKQMAELGMNAYLAVSRGSRNPAYLSLVEYKNNPNPNAQPIVLVGKGLTFDAGGISLKPADSMDEMKYDMGGAAAVYGVMRALVDLKLPLNVVGILAGCENLPDGDAYRPGDILTTMAGLSVEVLNTDAEGRLVLCDTLTYVEKLKPALVIDIATLTGACVVALGQHNSGLLSPNDILAEQLQQAAAASGDKIWRLPISEEYQEQLKSNFADLANIGGRWGGASTAAAFLANFTQNYPWAHLDIAGTAWLQGAQKGATGRPVSCLLQFLFNQVERNIAY